MIAPEVAKERTDLFAFAEHNQDNAERTGYSDYSYWKSTIRVFIRNRIALAALIVVTVLLVFTFVQPFLPGQRNPNLIHINPETGRQLRNAPPGSEFILGTNAIGQDLWARIWMGTRTSMTIGIVVATIRVVAGILVGAVWGYVRKTDRIMTEIYNVLANIPTTIVMILFAYILRPSMRTMIIAMTVLGWLPISRFIRNQVVIIRDREYNLASRCLGTPTRRIIVRNILPYLVSVIMLQFALAIPLVIAGEVFLSYIGLGLPLNIPSLGNLVNEGRQLMMIRSLRHQLIYPSVILSLITISFYVMGNAFADAADPRTHV
ncbi:MAG: ABC transporter permease [Spirochaetaceae bacterium]|nr:MAG: ABC transporter permease [Spirochaetaceae bacterium]